MTGKFYGTITQMIIDPRFGRAHDTYPGKTMGLAATGKLNKKFLELIESNKEEINKLHIKGCEHLLQKFGLTNDYSKPWDDEKRRDLAFTAQFYWENQFFEKIKEYRKYSENLVLVGGCAYNVLLNSKLADSGIYQKVYISPVSGDCGQSLGAILYNNPGIKCDYPFLGRSFGEIPKELEENVVKSLVKDILDHKIVAWYQGRSETGPRALGHRSFLGLPDSKKMLNRISVEIKKREPYRPVAPIVIEDDLKKFFLTEHNSQYMTFSPKVKEITKILAPAIVHFDQTSRIQTLSQKDNPVLYRVLAEIGKKTGAPIIMNTSFNVNGEPLVDSPDDAFRNFEKSGADVLYINGRRYENGSKI
jgi:carbamoyltransferase